MVRHGVTQGESGPESPYSAYSFQVSSDLGIYNSNFVYILASICSVWSLSKKILFELPQCRVLDIIL